MKKLTSIFIVIILLLNFVSCDILTPDKGQYIKVSSINLSETNIIGYRGDTFLLSATINPSNATNSSVKWSSSAPDVASVSSIGLVTLNNPGNATISAVSADGAKAYCYVTVERNIEQVVINLSKSNAGKYLEFYCEKQNGGLWFSLGPKREYDNEKYEFNNVSCTVSGTIYAMYCGNWNNKEFYFTLFNNSTEYCRAIGSIERYSYEIVNITGTLTYYVEH